MDLDGIGHQFRRATVGSQGFLVPAVRGEKIPISFVDAEIVRNNPQGLLKAISHIFGTPSLPGLAQISVQGGEIVRRRTGWATDAQSHQQAKGSLDQRSFHPRPSDHDTI